MVLFTMFTALLTIVFFIVLAYALNKISNALCAIGGSPTSYLAKLRLGLRAIEVETGHLTPQVVKANENLIKIAGGLSAVDGHLIGVVNAAVAQKRYL
jgi:hypothetical protein